MKLCPKCNLELEPKNIGPVQVDECHKCKGIWFDKEEFRQAKDSTDSDLNWMDFDIWKHADKFKAKESSLKCPVCMATTQEIHYGETPIEIDYCSKCQGTWLDKDEFEKIIEALNEELLAKSFKEYISSSIEEAKEIVTGPESFISEWKDFATVLRLMQYRLFIENPKLLNTVINIQRINPLR
jgi:Zn-finger nucleic acid-binding protein